MSTKAKTGLIDSAGGARSEAGGRAQRPAGAARLPQGPLPVGLPDEVRDRLADEVIDELLAGARTEEEIVGPGGVLAQLTKRLVERALSAELTDHLGYEPHQEPPGGTGNTRNGSTAKTLATEHGAVRIETPRDRKGSFEPQIIRKGQRRFEGFDDKILALYSRGVSTRDIEAHLAEIYGVKVGRDLISRVTDAVMDDVREWQQRPLDDVYPVVFLDAMVLKIREGGSVQRRACYLALGVTVEVARDLKPIYTAADADAAQAALEAFDDKWGSRFPVITQAWLNAWEYVTPFLVFPPELRRVVYTTNAIEALNRQLRKAIKTKGHFPNEEAARKLIYLAITNAVPAWTRTRNWTTALLAFKIHFGDRLPE